MTAVEWPIQVYFILVYEQVKSGLKLIGSWRYSYSWSAGIPKLM